MSAVRVLLGKEMRQISRSRAALASSTLLPLLLITVAPMGQLVALRLAPMPPTQPPPIPSGMIPPGLAMAVQEPALFFVRIMLPLFITLGGLIVPSISATYTVVSEREKRTLDLLMALPVGVADILLAKVLSMLILAAAVVLPLFAIDSLILIALGFAGPLDILLLLALLVSALACSLGEALLLALLARDFRTANNLNGALLGPLIIFVLGVLFFVPGPAHYAVLVISLLAAGSLAVWASLSWLTFERYLA